MKCIGCDEDAVPAAYAIMNEQDLSDYDMMGRGVVRGHPGTFVALPICAPCFVDPSHRKHTIKAHYCSREQVGDFLRAAGSSNIGG